MEGFADIEGPLWIGPLWLLLLGACLAAALVAVSFIWLRRKKSTVETAALTPLRSPLEIAHERLGRLRNEGGTLEAEPYTVEVSDIVRDYIESALRLPAREQTSEEFLNSLNDKPELPDVLHENMPGFLEQCDRVKFARQNLEGDQRDRLLDTAETVVDVTDAHLNQERETATPSANP